MLFWDEEYIDDKVNELKEKIENDTIDKQNCNNFISEDELEDEFSHNEIGDAQEMFMAVVREWLFENYPGQYAMWCDWCVHITTTEVYREIMWKNNNYREDYVQMREKRDIVG